MIENVVNRAEILIQQTNYTEAEKLLKESLRLNPNDSYILALLSEVSLQLDKTGEAGVLVDIAIGINPSEARLFYIKAKVNLQKDEYDNAEKNLKQALEIEAGNASYYALWASVKLARKQFESALQLANKSLELDAENILGLNTRSTALLKLNKREDSFKTIDGALREDPNNAYTHANYGWNLLEKGDRKKALKHFREALKIDPNFKYAQSGMVEALKANNILYKLFLKYSFWIGNLSAKYQWAVIIGFYVGFRILRAIASNNEDLQPYLTPLIILLAIVAFSTWVISPLSNLMLRLNSYGRYLLDKKEITSSNFVGISLIIFFIGILSYFIMSENNYLTIAAFGFAMMLPCSVMLSPSKYKYSLIIYTCIMALTGFGAIVNAFDTGEIFNRFSSIFILGFIAFQWVANFLLIKQDNI